MSSTRRQQENGRDAEPDVFTDASVAMDATERGAALVREADRLISEIVEPGRWPQLRTVERFLEGDRLQRVLALYSEAIRLDESEPAYPWNLASTLNRLGMNELALSFIERAIRTAADTGDEEWAGLGAHLAWADMATSAGHYDTALIALARANRLAGGSARARADVRRLRTEIERRMRQPHPERTLARELDALSA